jgi:tRNA pseudouridine38-40 synthase
LVHSSGPTTYAFRIGYLADGFQGYARQPSAWTVEGVLLDGLVRRNALDLTSRGSFRTASRTDRGVHALGNVVSFPTSLSGPAAARVLGSLHPHIFYLGWAQVAPDFQPRHARERWYRYLEPAQDRHLEAWQEGARLFEGEHEFASFSRKDDPPRPTRLLLSRFHVEKQGEFLVADVRAPRFLWNQVRKMISALQLLDEGALTAPDLRSALNGQRSLALPPALPGGLVLMDVAYDFTFQKLHPALSRPRDALGAELGASRIRNEVLGLLLERL